MPMLGLGPALVGVPTSCIAWSPLPAAWARIEGGARRQLHRDVLQALWLHQTRQPHRHKHWWNCDRHRCPCNAADAADAARTGRALAVCHIKQPLLGRGWP